MVTARLLVAIAVMFAASIGTAAPDPPALVSARGLISEVRYEEAAAAIELAVAGGTLTARQLADAYRLGGEVYAALGKEAKAHEYFVRLLLLVPGAELAGGSSPKISGPFDSARATVAERGPLTVVHRVRRDASTVRIEVEVSSDPLSMVHGVRVLYRTGTGDNVRAVESRGSLVVNAVVPGDSELRAVIRVLDDHGNELAEIGSWDAPVTVAEVGDFGRTSGAVGPTNSPRRRRPLYAQWYTWAGVSLVAVGAGAYFGSQASDAEHALELLNAESPLHSYGEALTVENRGRRNALLANVSFGLAGAAALAAVLTAVRGSYDDEQPPVVRPALAGASIIGIAIDF